jgi:hypothetical protein
MRSQNFGCRRGPSPTRFMPPDPAITEQKTLRQRLAPIAVFAYDRPHHLRRCIEALRENELAVGSDLFIFSDAAKEPEQSPNVGKVRDYIRAIEGFRSVTVAAQPQNLGLAASVIAGVTKLVSQFGSVIVIEDDLVVSPYFLQFMNDGLAAYANDNRVAAIHGYMFPVGRVLPEIFFLRDPGCWGWATWKRAWDLFKSDGGLLRRELEARDLKWTFDYDGQYDYSGMLDDQIAGRVSSWAVRWYASVFLRDMLTLHPGASLVTNIGQDGSGTHDVATGHFKVHLTPHPVHVGDIPVLESPVAREAMIAYLSKIRSAGSKSFVGRTLLHLRGLGRLFS